MLDKMIAKSCRNYFQYTGLHVKNIPILHILVIFINFDSPPHSVALSAVSDVIDMMTLLSSSATQLMSFLGGHGSSE